MDDIFLVAKIQIFIWVLEIPDILLGWTVDAEPKPTYEKNESTLPPWVCLSVQTYPC